MGRIIDLCVISSVRYSCLSYLYQQLLSYHVFQCLSSSSSSYYYRLLRHISVSGNILLVSFPFLVVFGWLNLSLIIVLLSSQLSPSYFLMTVISVGLLLSVITIYIRWQLSVSSGYRVCPFFPIYFKSVSDPNLLYSCLWSQSVICVSDHNLSYICEWSRISYRVSVSDECLPTCVSVVSGVVV